MRRGKAAGGRGGFGRAWCPGLCGLLVLAVAATAWGQPGAGSAAGEEAAGASPREAAREHYDAGASAFEAGAFGAALEHLEESYRLFPALRTLYTLALCRHAVGDFPGGARALEQYLREAGDEAPAELRAHAEGLVAAMRAEMGRLEIRVTVNGAELRVDGVVVGRSPLGGPVDLGPGWHVVEARREEYEPAAGRVHVEAGATATVSLAPAALPVEPVGEGGGEPAAVVVAPPAAPPVAVLYGPPAGVSEQEWYGIGDEDYQEYVFSTGRHQPLANWILERNREDPDMTWAEVIAASQGAAWLASGTLVYLFYERYEDYDLPWMSFFEWLLGGALTLAAIGTAIVDALDIGKVAVAHPERLTGVPQGAAPPSTASVPRVTARLGVGGLTLRF